MIDNNSPEQGTPPSPFPPPLAQPPAAQPQVPQAGIPAPATFQVAVPAQQLSQNMQPTPQAVQQQNKRPVIYTCEESTDYFVKGRFDQDVAAYQANAGRTTGYKVLDQIQPLYPGFYCLGAIPSLGKTTYAQQLADQVAASGQYVLYFSLEQTAFELFSKSLARGFFRTNRVDTRTNNRPSSYPTPSSIDIRRGIMAQTQELTEQVNSYIQAVQNRIWVIYGTFSYTVEDIRDFVEEFVNNYCVRPIVIVDYLQIISPTQINGRVPDTKTSVDHIVHMLKALQNKYDLTVIAISSLNRQNYLMPIDFESFKESGGIEYTADVIWGLQLSVLGSDDFYHQGKKETSLREKREMVQKAKVASPRLIDLVCLKNRYGRSSYTVPFEYFPAHDYFCPPYDPNNPLTLD